MPVKIIPYYFCYSLCANIVLHLTRMVNEKCNNLSSVKKNLPIQKQNREVIIKLLYVVVLRSK
jgi:hypothetical protein